jgi:hypothetical protein
MLKRVLAMMLVSLLVNAVISVQLTSASSKPDKQTKFTEKVRLSVARLGVGNKALVEIRLRDKSKLTGYISEANQTHFVVTNEKTHASVPVDYTDVTKVNGHNLSTGAKIGIGIAVGFALTVAVIFLLKG